MNKDHFIQSVKDHFQYLQGNYGFSVPIAEYLGRETVVRYERGDQTVSISCEAGMSPLIEIFYPSFETGDKPIPWAKKNDVPRSRRFPKIGLATPFSEDEASLENYLKDLALAFEKAEAAWLASK